MPKKKQNMLEKKRELEKGKLIPTYFDETFKIMHATSEHMETLTLLFSRVLKVEYKDIE